ncbi:MAG TPA: M2 family metallopeptidase [Vicinamibacterales bacterium]|nr:M2 family metallopeptidase [Vicinamibacterales bacterium]
MWFARLTSVGLGAAVLVAAAPAILGHPDAQITRSRDHRDSEARRSGDRPPRTREQRTANREPRAQSSGEATPAEARQFLDEVDREMLRLSIAESRAGWVQSTYITPDTEALAAQAGEALISALTEYAKRAVRFRNTQVSPAERRQLELLRTSLTMSAPPDPKEAEELTRLVTSMEGVYGRGKYCPPGGGGDGCLDITEITRILAESRDPKRLHDVWAGWHTISVPFKDDYTRFVELSNRGAKVLGFADTGAMWRSKYDMPPAEFSNELDRLWKQLQPLYVSLHAYVRARLRDEYGTLVPERGPIPAHLLGNLWQQDWSNIFPVVAPPGQGPTFSLTGRLKAKQIDALEMVRIGERFFTSLGFEPLPETFWERSMFVKPRDREVVCHASAWNIDSVDDLRIKMCIDVTAEDFTTIHHELGHNFYQRAYNRQPMIFRDSANDGFHEAIGDTLALSVTPDYLVKIGLLDRAPDASGDTALLLRSALERLAFLPFGLLVDQWRWQVFDGTISPANYNRAWWALKLKYQGVAPVEPRGEELFDPGAKYHVPGNTPYTRYFLAGILQFQFHRALAKAAGCAAPLHRCSIYGSREAGRKLTAMLEMGASRPWPDALEVLTGQREMDASAMADYFAPLKTWLDEQNRGKPVGW